ncbi:hypothetical protein [Thiorhodovibrio litoralis]|uniref:hypothetical protein n=1 Tax=Thiorhodovibrio litoralis TaxID=2952932 RepID=UPI002B25B625|nr:hypothetical protein [Thiorhodovibrio litoralis]MBK5970106.1 hypothetical protein [Thiorhodovibrio winogradskyi]WPL13488.1 hypothetical protein Thiosp_03291 [Thiorhodovibrio litoralis]
MDDDGSAWYMLGFATGLGFGVAIAAPDRHSVVVPLEKDQRAALEQADAGVRMEREICLRVREAFSESLGSDEGLDFLCGDPSESTGPGR